MEKFIVIVGVVVLAIVCVVLWVVGQEGSEHLDGLPEIQGLTERHEANRAAQVPAKTNVLSSPFFGLQSNNGAVERTRGLDETNSILVRVIDEKTNEPVGAAIVSVIPYSIGSAMRAKYLIEEDPIVFFRDYGKLFRTDLNGEVRIPKNLRHSMLAGLKGRRFCRGYFVLQSPSEIVLKLAPLTRVAVRVLDAQGALQRDVEVVLGLVLQNGDPGTVYGLAHRRVIARQTTGPNGMAYLSLTAKFLEGMKKNECLSVALPGMLGLDDAVIFAPGEIPKDTVDLTIPSAGSIRFHIKDVDGNPCQELVLITFRKEEAQGDFFSRGRGKQYTGMGIRGELFVPFVTCGIKLAVHAMGEFGSTLETIEMSVDGPRSPGDITDVTLQFIERAHRFTCLIVNSNGEPLANESLVVQLSVDSRPVEYGLLAPQLTTDFKGRLNGLLDSRAQPKKTVENRSLRIEKLTRGILPNLLNKVELPKGPIDKSLDLGTVVLATPQLLLEGRIVDDRGEPLRQAIALVHPKNEEDSGRLSPASCRVDSSGDFAIFGDFESPELMLSVFTGSEFRISRTVARGTDVGEIVVPRFGQLKGRLIVAANISVARISIQIEGEAGTRPRTSQAKGKGEFEFKSIPPGSYSVKILGNSRTPVHEIPFVYVAPGEKVDLGDIAVVLTGLQLHLEVVNPLIVQSDGVLVTVHNPQTGKELQRFVMRSSRESCFVFLPSCDLRMSLAEYAPIVMKKVISGNIPIRFKKGIPLLIKRKSAPDIPSNKVPHFFLERSGSEERIWLGRLIREKTIHVEKPGVYEVFATLNTTGLDKRITELLVTGGSIRVNRQEDLQKLTIRLEKESIGLAVEQLEVQNFQH